LPRHQGRLHGAADASGQASANRVNPDVSSPETPGHRPRKTEQLRLTRDRRDGPPGATSGALLTGLGRGGRRGTHRARKVRRPRKLCDLAGRGATSGGAGWPVFFGW
ncbi:MAG: hypothetical protein AAGF84_12285, partial [Planctomycetota bacterium]